MYIVDIVTKVFPTQSGHCIIDDDSLTSIGSKIQP